MKYVIEGREYETYEMSNNMLVSAINSEEYKDDKDLVATLIYRFVASLCTMNGETEDDVFARFFSKFVNGKMRSPKEVAKKMAQDHRYLQQEMFKVCIEYIKILAENYSKGWYDGRNELSCRISNKIVECCKEKEFYI